MKLSYFPGNEDLVIWVGGPEEEEIQIEQSLLVVTDLNWEKDLTPWPADPVFKKQDPFTGHADESIMELNNLLKPYLQKQWHSVYAIGYSLAGLFALYWNTKDTFTGCASISGSLWYPDFLDYLQEHPVKCSRVYLSLGDREALSKQKYLHTVLEQTQKARGLLSEYCDVTLEMNPGNHFYQADQRVLKGIKWLVNRK